MERDEKGSLKGFYYDNIGTICALIETVPK